MAEIDRLAALKGAEINEAKKVLATEATALLHGRAKAEAAAKTAQETFEQGALAKGLPTVEIAAAELSAGIGVLSAFVKAGLVKSNGEARRQIAGGGLRVNDAGVTDESSEADGKRRERRRHQALARQEEARAVEACVTRRRGNCGGVSWTIAWSCRSDTALVGSYRIMRVVASGGFGITYEAEDTGLGAVVAIKEYYPFDFGDRDPAMSVGPKSERHKQTFEWGRANFLREARTLARFDHPSIVRVTRVFEANATAYMVMRFEHGLSLEAWLDCSRPAAHARAAGSARGTAARCLADHPRRRFPAWRHRPRQCPHPRRRHARCCSTSARRGARWRR